MNDAYTFPNVAVASFNGVPQKFQAHGDLKDIGRESINLIYYSTGLIFSTHQSLLPMAVFTTYKITILGSAARMTWLIF
jgi:hypothetical protein